jgi:hypothetical protein
MYFYPMKHITSTARIVLIYALCYACSPSTSTHSESLNDTTATSTENSTELNVQDTTKFKFDFALANIPSPAQIMVQMHSKNTISNEVLLKANLADAFNNEFVKSLAMGVYNIDFAYSVQTNQSQNVLNYMKAIAAMSMNLGLKNALDQILGQRVEQNLSQKDSLFSILDDVFYKSDAFLKTNKRMKVASLIFTGSWIEALYLNGIGGQQANDEATKLYAKTLLWQQRFHLENLIRLLNDFKSDAQVDILCKDLNSILVQIQAEKQAEKIQDKRFAELIQSISNLRAKLFKV